MANEDDNKKPSPVPTDPTYDGTIGGGEIIQVWTSQFPNADFWKVTWRANESDANAATEEQFDQAMFMEKLTDTTAELIWTGFIDPALSLNFYYTVSCRDTNDCFKGSAQSELLFDAVTNACSPGDCGTDPSMQVTVTGASGTIDWLGETWNLPADSGIEKCVCPTFYNNFDYPSFPSIDNPNIARETWRRETTIVPDQDRLSFMGYNYYALSQAFMHHKNEQGNNVQFLLNYGLDNVSVISYGGGVNLATVTPTYKAMPLGAPMADGLLTGSLVTTGGITYAWARGEDW